MSTSRALRVTAAAAALAIPFALAGCGASSSSKTTAPAPKVATPGRPSPTGKGHTVTFKATTTAKAGVSYSAGSGVSGHEEVSSDWSKDVQVNNDLAVLSLTVLPTDIKSGGGAVGCEILVDGVSKVMQSGTSTSMAMCTAPIS